MGEIRTLMVSVIIPIYNVSNFINRGVEQVLAQTYNNYEIILVNDGSTDESLEICNAWARKDDRIRVISKRNGGAGSARNIGIEKAQGDFIYFYDIDDKISSNLLEYCVRTIEQYDVDLIVFGYESEETTYNSSTTVRFTEKVIRTNDELRDCFVDEFVLKMNGFPWNKFYRKSFLDENGLRYENQRIQQDEVFNLKVYQRLERVYISPKVLYTYYVYEKGNTRSRFIEGRFDIYKSVNRHFVDLKKFWRLNDSRFEDYLNARFYQSFLQCAFYNLFHPDCSWTKIERVNELDRMLNDEMTIDSLEYAKKAYKSIEHKVYRWTCHHKQLWLMRIMYLFFNSLHKIRKKIK